MKTLLIILLILFSSVTAFTQQLREVNIDDCYRWAEENYPLVKQRELLNKSKEYSIASAASYYLPQLTIGGQATYQSDVTQLPFTPPNIEIETPSKDQYKVFAEVNQTLIDGGVIKNQKKLQEINGRVEQQKLEVEIYKLKERINQLYFGSLLIQEQIKQVAILKEELETGLKKTEGAIINGIGLKSSADVLRSELLKVQQRMVELEFARKANLTILSMFINKEIDDNATLKTPGNLPLEETVIRPELKVFETQREIFHAQDKLISSRYLPKLGASFQVGYGRPALNMLNNNFDYYYIGGVRFNWVISGFYSTKKERQLLEINNNLSKSQEETFLFNNTVNRKQQTSEINKLEELITLDRHVIELKARIKETARAQLENGVITVNDYLKEVNEEELAKQSLLFHQVQLLFAQYNLQTLTGK